MSGWTKAHESIQGQLVGRTGMRVLVVEGEDDRAFITSLLEKGRAERWANTWTVGVAEGKQNVLRILAKEHTWIGVVDRDEWSDAAATKAKADHPNLFVLPRFCMENYFIDPDEIWAALPEKQKEQIGQTREDQFKADIGANLDAWLRHGALWHAVNPLWDGLRAIGFKEKLLKMNTAQDDAEIQETLASWHELLDPARIFREFSDNLEAARQSNISDQYRKWIHGKKFFREEVVSVLNRYLGQSTSEQRLIEIRGSLPLPSDLDDLWLAMGL